MRCDGDRCSALSGKVGEATASPDLRRAARSVPHLHARRCRMPRWRRKRHSLPVLAVVPAMQDARAPALIANRVVYR